MIKSMTKIFSISDRKSGKRKGASQNFNLTEEEFYKLVKELKNGNEELLTHIYSSQLDETVNYLKSKFSISSDRAYDLCLDALVKLRKKILNDKISYGNLRYLFTRIASNSLIDAAKKEKKINEAIEVFLGESEFSGVDSQEVFEMLDKACDVLKEDQKELIQKLFFEKIDMKTWAREKNIDYGTLRKRKQRVLEKIREEYIRLLNPVK